MTTPADLARLYRSLGEGGRFQAEGETMRARLNAFDGTGLRGYGIGVYVRRDEDDHYRMSHGGDFGGYRSAVLYDSASGIALAVQANDKRFEAPDFAFELLEMLTAAPGR